MAERFVRTTIPHGESTDCPTCRNPILGGEAAVYGRRSVGDIIVTATACSMDCCRDALGVEVDRSELFSYRVAFDVAALTGKAVQK